jgi:hypothetical protein
VELLPELSCRAERQLVEVSLIRGAAVKARVGTPAIVQKRLRTPTGPFFARFFIGITLGLGAEFAFMDPSTRVMVLFFAARWTGRKQIVGWKCQHGCSTGRRALTPSF